MDSEYEMPTLVKIASGIAATLVIGGGVVVGVTTWSPWAVVGWVLVVGAIATAAVMLFAIIYGFIEVCVALSEDESGMDE